MGTKKVTRKNLGKGLLVGIVLSSTIATGIGHGGLTSLSDLGQRKNYEGCEIRGTGREGAITDDDLRNKLKCDLMQVGYVSSALNVSEDELLSLHEKEFGIRKGRVYVSQVEPYHLAAKD